MTVQLRAAAERTMLDRCTITRDPAAPDNRPFDEQTLTYGPAPTATAIYGGRCSVTPDTDTMATSQTEGGQDIYRDQYRARIPLAATCPQIGDWLTVTAVAPHGDPALVGLDLQVTKVITRSRAVTRQLRLVDRTRGPRT